jgi:hypothetical protein
MDDNPSDLYVRHMVAAVRRFWPGPAPAPVQQGLGGADSRAGRGVPVFHDFGEDFDRVPGVVACQFEGVFGENCVVGVVGFHGMEGGGLGAVHQCVRAGGCELQGSLICDGAVQKFNQTHHGRAPRTARSAVGG